MSIFVKAGLWLEKKTGYKGEFNLTRYITDLIAATPPPTPTTPGLQEVIDAGTYVEFDGGNSSGEIMGGTFNNRSTYFDHASDTQSSGFDSSPNRFQAQNFVNGQSVAQLRFQGGEVQLSRTNLSVSPAKKSTLKINLPTNNINFILPAKSVDGDYIVATLDDISNRPYKVYTALISQSGSDPITGAPTVDVLLENTLGGSVTWSYIGVGTFKATLPITSTKIWVGITASNAGTGGGIAVSSALNTEVIISPFDTASGNPLNNVMVRVSIEIRVYN